MEQLPEWEAGNVAILTTMGDAPHAIPVSTAVRAGPRRLLLALALRRRSLELLRAQPRVALTILAGGDVVAQHPPGTEVTLPDGRTAVVADVSLDAPSRPTVRVREGAGIAELVVDL
jgi:hypothetical protein